MLEWKTSIKFCTSGFLDIESIFTKDVLEQTHELCQICFK